MTVLAFMEPGRTTSRARVDSGAAATNDAITRPSRGHALVDSRIARKRAGTSPEQGDTRALARAAGLRYVSDSDPGYTRRRYGGRFAYFDVDGARIRDRDEIRRIDSLAIPPAYQHVWICRNARGHIQATGRDARGRKQYRYHAKWNEASAAAKFDRMLAFGEKLPRIRRIVARALRQSGMPREKVLAAVVQLLDLTLIRVGNDEYARQNRSYGLTTLLTRHVEVEGTKVTFGFRGKSGIEHRIALRHRGLAVFMKACLKIPGRELFQYFDDNGRRRAVTSTDVNGSLQAIGDPSISAKDFRTWGASAMALGDLHERTFSSQTDGKREAREMFKAVAERLGNTATVCRKSYIHPHVVECFLGATLAEIDVTPKRGLKPHEAAFLSLLRVTSTNGAPPRRHSTTAKRAGVERAAIRRAVIACKPRRARPSSRRAPDGPTLH